MLRQVQQSCFLMTLLCAAYITASGPEFLYPIGTVQHEEQEKLCVLYQQNSHLELWLWDPVTHVAIKGLSQYTPAGAVVLPSGTAVSFIDHERIRIKSIMKKSPKTLDLHPLYDFSMLHWIDDANCYCFARERHVYNLFHITAEGDFYRLTDSTTAHYTYPQKIGEDLFCIKKSSAGKHTIQKALYPLEKIKTFQACLDEECAHNNSKENIELYVSEIEEGSSRATISESEQETIYTCNDHGYSLTFLNMISATEGFFIKHLEFPFTKRTDTFLVCEYWHLAKGAAHWHAEKLFSFNLPLNLFLGKHRLYESMLRLIPIKNESLLYFSSADAQGSLDLYTYSLEDHSITQVSQKSNDEHAYFAPFFYKGVSFYGGALSLADSQLTVSLDERGQQIMTFPFISI